MALLNPKILEIEGGYSNDPHDRGGETKFGICKRSYPHLDIKNLTEKQALQIYAQDYWFKNRLNEIESQGLADTIFYLIVNTGAIGGVRTVQRALVAQGFKTVIDGRMGTRTLADINAANAHNLLNEIKIMTCGYYLNIVMSDKTQERFLKGWFNRVLNN